MVKNAHRISTFSGKQCLWKKKKRNIVKEWNVNRTAFNFSTVKPFIWRDFNIGICAVKNIFLFSDGHVNSLFTLIASIGKILSHLFKSSSNSLVYLLARNPKSYTKFLHWVFKEFILFKMSLLRIKSVVCWGSKTTKGYVVTMATLQPEGGRGSPDTRPALPGMEKAFPGRASPSRYWESLSTQVELDFQIGTAPPGIEKTFPGRGSLPGRARFADRASLSRYWESLSRQSKSSR